jgi:hypothetical protein
MMTLGLVQIKSSVGSCARTWHLEGYKLQWPLGPDNLLLVSVGTGDGEDTLTPDRVMKMSAVEQAMRSPRRSSPWRTSRAIVASASSCSFGVEPS